MDQITINTLPKINNKPVSFDNPHNWTEQQVIDCFNQVRKTLRAAYGIQCMAVADLMKRGKYDD